VDISHCIGHPDAVTASTEFLQAVGTHRPDCDPWTVTGRALHATTIYHQVDCGRGRHLLTELIAVTHDHLPAITVMLTAGLAVMTDGCFPERVPASRPPPPMPGGVLHPAVHDPHPEYLAHRAGLRPGRHPSAPRPCSPP
jgi:hypothetical protein